MAQTPRACPRPPSTRRYLKGTTLPALKPHLGQGNVISSPVLPPPPRGLPQAQEKGCSWPLLGADDVAGPGLVLGARRQVGDDHLHGLQLLVLGRDGTHLVGDLVAFHRHVLPFHAAGWGEALSAHTQPSRAVHSPCRSEGHPGLLGELPLPPCALPSEGATMPQWCHTAPAPQTPTAPASPFPLPPCCCGAGTQSAAALGPLRLRQRSSSWRCSHFTVSVGNPGPLGQKSRGARLNQREKRGGPTGDE